MKKLYSQRDMLLNQVHFAWYSASQNVEMPMFVGEILFVKWPRVETREQISTPSHWKARSWEEEGIYGGRNEAAGRVWGTARGKATGKQFRNPRSATGLCTGNSRHLEWWDGGVFTPLMQKVTHGVGTAICSVGGSVVLSSLNQLSWNQT